MEGRVQNTENIFQTHIYQFPTHYVVSKEMQISQQINSQLFTGQIYLAVTNQYCQSTVGKCITFHALALPKFTRGSYDCL